MAGPCDDKRREADRANSSWTQASDNLNRDPNHQEIESLNRGIVSSTKRMGATTDKQEIAELRREIDTARARIAQLKPQVTALASEAERLQKLKETAEGELRECEERHPPSQSGGGQTR